ncbi:MAG: FecR domain-containing protein [Alphaproteobacteria bacterium]|nr:FecR domain-containing protein [Alphaproteobacteria bacterium]
MVDFNQAEAMDDVTLVEAEHWHNLMTSDHITPAQQKAFKAWFDEDLKHQEAYAQVFICHDAGMTAPLEDPAPAANDNWKFAPFITAVAASLFLILAGFYLFDPEPEFTSHGTQTAEIRTIDLPDGSVITLGASSAIDVSDFSSGGRYVALRHGEALFDIAHDPEHPFTVGIGQTTVEVLGTRFTVNQSNDQLAVSLIEGEVAINHIREAGFIPFMKKTESVTLAPSQTVRVIDNNLGIPKTAQTSQMDSWVSGTRSYFDAPLAAVIADINRYSNTPVRLKNPSIGHLPVTLVFSVSQIETMLETLPQIAPVKLSTDNGTIIIDAAF